MTSGTELVKKQAIEGWRTILERSLLTSDQVTQLVSRYDHERSDYLRWYVDWDLLDLFKDIWSKETERKKDIDQLIESAKDRNLSKMFFNRVNTLSNWYHFLDEDVTRPSARWNENLRVAHYLLEKDLHVTRLKPIECTFDNLDVIWTDKSKSAGAIGQGSKDVNRAECFEAAMRIKRAIAEGRDFSEIWIPYLQFHRSQLGSLITEDRKYSGNPKHKDRLVFGCDGGTVTVEGCYARPLIEHVSQHWYSYSGGDNPEDIRLKIRECRYGKHWTSIDFSRFDQTIQAWLIDDAFSIIMKFFDASCRKELEWISYQFKNSWLVCPDGVMQKHRGIPSGSNFTQVVGSMCNALIIMTYLASRAPKGCGFEEKVRYVERELSIVNGGRGCVGKHTMLVMGDDNLLFTMKPIELEDLSKYAARIFGVKINPEKTSHGGPSEYPEYLKREWRYAGEYRDPLELAIQVVHPEREREYENYGPWHIMYGLWQTYREAFPKRLKHMDFIRGMEQQGGIERLLELDLSNLPGSLRAWGDRSLKRLYLQAESLRRYKATT